MAVSKNFSLRPDADFGAVMRFVGMTLWQLGRYQVKTEFSGENAAQMTVHKDYEGLTKLVGLGLETRVQASLQDGRLAVQIEHDWTYKIFAILLGWFFCAVPMVTGVIGALNQASMTNVVLNAFSQATHSAPTDAYPPPAGGAAAPEDRTE